MYGPESGGLRTTVDRLAREYLVRGHQVMVLTPSDGDADLSVNNLRKITLKSPLIPRSGGYRIILRLGKVRQLLREYKPDVIEVSDRTTLVILVPWARRRGIKVVLFAHERLTGVLLSFIPKQLPARHLVNWLVAKWNQRCANNMDRIIATTNFAAEEFSGFSNVTLVPLGVDHETFYPGPIENRVESARGKRYLLACTRLSPEKDPLFLLEVARQLCQVDLQLSLVVIGSGPLLESLQETIRTERLDISLQGFIDDKTQVAQYMRDAEIFLAVGPLETFGLAALESLACGTPVICRDSAAIAEIVDNHSGRALARDARSWVSAIEEFLGADRSQISQACHERAARFTWSTTAETLLDQYQELMSEDEVLEAGVIR